MRRWKLYSVVALAMALGTFGCGGSSPTSVTLTISPTTSSVVTNTTEQFTATVSGSSNTNVTWALTCATGVTANTCGTINSAGLYTAPATVPTTTSNGTTVIAPTVTITGTSQADTTKVETATVTIITGISISITPASATIGTGEHFTFSATVSNPGCNTTSNTTCLNVTWSLSTTLTGIGTIDPNLGTYTAPATVPSPSAVTVTATSVSDTSVTATAVVNVVTSTLPTVTSVTPNTMGLGGVFQDFYITGTNFISTNNVFVNGVQLDAANVADVSSSVIRGRISDFTLAAPPASGILQVSVSQQVGPPQTCADASQCQIAIVGVRPGVVGPSPDTITQGSTTVIPFNVDGGFFGTATNPAVSATYAGQLRAIQVPTSGSTNSTRQLTVNLGGGSNTDLATPGLYPIAIRNATNPAKFAVTNLAVQPNYLFSSISTVAAQLPVGSLPSDVAINPATGMAVVANMGSNSVSLIQLTGSSAAPVATICTASVGAAAPCPSSGPSSVAVDYVRNIALVVNSATSTVAVVDLNNQAVSYVTPAFQNIPGAVGINPVTGRALVAMQQQGYGMLMDLTQNPPAIIGVVTISTGPKTRVAVEPHLNWAIATPGGAGTVGIVDLNAQTVNNITTLSRTTNVVTVTVQAPTAAAPQPPLAVQLNDAVLIQNASDPSFDGIYSVTGVGPGGSQFSYTQPGNALPDITTPFTSPGTVNYAHFVATNSIVPSDQGIAINPQTQQAVIVDPGANGVISFFSLIDQTTSPFQLTTTTGSNEATGPIAAAYNPLTNTIVTVNNFDNTYSIINPTTPSRLLQSGQVLSSPVAVAIDPGTNVAVIVNQGNNSVMVLNLGAIQPFSITETSPKTFVANSTLTSAASPSAVTLTVQGMGFVNGSVVRLDGVGLQTTYISNRQLTAIAPPSLLSRAHRFALDVQNSGGAITNAEDFTVEQSVDVTGCSATPYPSGVAIDPQQNLVAVTLNGCNSLALISLATGTGNTVAVGNNPIGVAVLPSLHLAVVANNADGTASVVDELGQSVTQLVTTGSGSFGVAVDQDTQEAAVANSTANTVTVLNVISGSTNSISTGQRPVAVGFNYQDHQVGIATTGSNTFAVADGAASSTTQSFTVNEPTAVVYDPVPADCGTNNTYGCFIVTGSGTNSVEVVDPISQQTNSFAVGINPTAIAYNYLTSTLVTTNTSSHTITVADFLGKKPRAVLTLPPAPVISNLSIVGSLQFALDIHPLTNLVVIADTANGRVLFVPIPY
ncbi:MAG: YncE family protein [Candidatus Acidiferrales bacterium]